MRAVRETLEAVHPPTQRKATKMGYPKFDHDDTVRNVYTGQFATIVAVYANDDGNRYDVKYDGSDTKFSGVESAFDWSGNGHERHPLTAGTMEMLDHLLDLAANLRVVGIVNSYEYRDIERIVSGAKSRVTARASDPGGDNF